MESRQVEAAYVIHLFSLQARCGITAGRNFSAIKPVLSAIELCNQPEQAPEGYAPPDSIWIANCIAPIERLPIVRFEKLERNFYRADGGRRSSRYGVFFFALNVGAERVKVKWVG